MISQGRKEQAIKQLKESLPKFRDNDMADRVKGLLEELIKKPSRAQRIWNVVINGFRQFGVFIAQCLSCCRSKPKKQEAVSRSEYLTEEKETKETHNQYYSTSEVNDKLSKLRIKTIPLLDEKYSMTKQRLLSDSVISSDLDRSPSSISFIEDPELERATQMQISR
jgi:hypothetical protein